MSRRTALAAAFLAPVLLTACQQQPLSPLPAPDGPSSPKSVDAAKPVAHSAPQTTLVELQDVDIRSLVVSVNAKVPLPPVDFQRGHVTPWTVDFVRVKQSPQGFIIELPSNSPIPTPTIYRGKLYISGGFSSREYYCLDARTGSPIWAKELDDDGPSSAMPSDDLIILGSESCTLFALHAETGEGMWSHWLGDPLLSMPTIAEGRVFMVYPASEAFAEELPGEAAMSEEEVTWQDGFLPTHAVACFDASSGQLIWRRWIDSDCMSAPLAAHGELIVATLSGTVYRFAQRDGTIHAAHRLNATSTPVLVDQRLYMTRRADVLDAEEVAECLTLMNVRSNRLLFAAARRTAPYLDQNVQRAASYSMGADGFEQMNGIGGGGFGGGFGGGGHFAVADDGTSPEAPPNPSSPQGQTSSNATATRPYDALGVTELQAASNIGLGNVSTLQNFQGSRILVFRDLLINCMGDQLTCVDAHTGNVKWTKPVEGDLVESGGHLATPPIAAGHSIIVGTVSGKVLRIVPTTGETLQSFDIGSEIRSPPVAADGRIYVATLDGKVVCINTTDPSVTGWPMWGGNPGHTNCVETANEPKPVY
ncbi:MAG: PQQ-binding-like beta-propeller repeat protein [Pirellulaceae bacterium]